MKDTAERASWLLEHGAEALETWNVDPSINAVEPGSPVGCIWTDRQTFQRDEWELGLR